MSGATTAEQLISAGIPPAAVRGRMIDRVARAADASHYLLTPGAVVVAPDSAAVAQLMRVCTAAGLPLTFRSGGTSLSGQAVTAGVLADTRRHFRGIEVLDDGRAVRVQPGATVRAVNTALRRHGTRLGPDPASEGACTIGGVVANNSSGMSCGTTANTYSTLRALTFVLPSGTVVDTSLIDVDGRLAVVEPELYRGLSELRDRVRADDAMRATITRLFSMKNTMGYGVNAFLDFDRPADILAHLVVGSEGTLAFVADATFETLPVLPEAATGLLVLRDLTAATAALPALVASGAHTIELLDAHALRVAAADPRAPRRLRDVTVESHSALLVEYQAADGEELEAIIEQARPAIGDHAFTGDAGERASLWRVRKGLYAAVAAKRPPGTTALLEDIAVPVPALSDTCMQLTEAFDEFGYPGSVIFGHAKDGNVHFMLCERFDDPARVDRYAAFTESMVDIVLGHGGTLKAEHGTGRAMAPYVRRQYGDDLYEVMCTVKRLCDPTGMLNPGVVLDTDASRHLRDLKTIPAVEAEVDRCVECGFCEPVCPSRDLTLTPRQRIVTRRAIASAMASGNGETVRELVSAYDYDGIQTCAADGMCETACPVAIDTGALARRLRAENAGRLAEAAGAAAARRWGAVTRGIRWGLVLARFFPASATLLSRTGRRILGRDVVPLYSRDLAPGSSRRVADRDVRGDVVLFTSCTQEMFGTADGVTASDAFRSLCAKADIGVATVPRNESLCCGMPWSSKGLSVGRKIMVRRVRDSLLKVTRNGAVTVVVDGSSCAEGLRTTLVEVGLDVEDVVTFTAREVLPRVDVEITHDKVAVHPTCAAVRLGATTDLLALAEAFAESAYVAESWNCCGFAGDRGMLHPELTEAATTDQAREIREAGASAHVSSHRTCEIGMSRAVGATYRHVLELLDQATLPRPRRSSAVSARLRQEEEGRG